MSRYSAVLVEDESTAEIETKNALDAAGFETTVFRDATSAMVGLASIASPIDLIVLDRRLPVRAGDLPEDEIGDQLLDEVLNAHPDVPVIVFSGHSNYEHLQFVMMNRGSLDIGNGHIVLSHVVAFEKGQSLEFDRHLIELRQCLDLIQDVSLTMVDTTETCTALERRILRRVAMEFNSVGVTAKKLTGGSSDASVWLCSLMQPDHIDATVVVKSSARRPPVGGFQAVIPAPLSATTMIIVRGLCGGRFVAVQQLAGNAAESLLDLIVEDPVRAAEGLGLLIRKLPDQVLGTVHRPLDQVVGPIKSWPEIVRRLQGNAISVPSGTQVARTAMIHQHGDLHPANVLFVDGAPVLIDFDRQSVGSALIDPVSLFLGPLFTRGSKLKSSAWPSPEQCSDVMSIEFLAGCPSVGYFTQAQNYVRAKASSARELQSVIVAFASRQFEYGDVKGDALVLGRALAIARGAAARLIDGVD